MAMITVTDTSGAVDEYPKPDVGRTLDFEMTQQGALIVKETGPDEKVHFMAVYAPAMWMSVKLEIDEDEQSIDYRPGGPHA